MELQQPYNIYLDYKGYMIEPSSYRVSPSPLMGTKFTTGRSAYSDLDFWQIGAITDFSKGINQKYMVDPSMSFQSVGLYLGKPGELSLERDTETFSGLPGGVGTITAHYRRLNELYIGDDTGHIMKSVNGDTFSIVYTITETDKKIYNFYEISGKLFATTGPGRIYVNEDPDTADVWTLEAISTQFPLAEYDGTPSGDGPIYSTYKVCQSFKVPMGGSTFHTLEAKLKKLGTPPADLTITIAEEDLDKPGQPGTTVRRADDSAVTFTFNKSSVTSSYSWMSKTITEFDLRAGVRYYLVAETIGGGIANCWKWGYESGSKATYGIGNATTYNTVDDWQDYPYRNQYFTLSRNTINDLYYVMVESDYGFGWFSDGIRRTIDGYNWIPEPPDPLWVMPSGEGIPLNAVAIPKSFISGSHRGLWAFVGGSSGINLWDVPDYSNVNNFRGMEKWGHYCVFSIEDQGLYYTDGSQVIPTTMTYLGEGFQFKSCKHIHSNGWDIYALISDNGSDWYLARTNMNYNSQPKYWWIVKKLDKEPARIVGWDDEKIFIFYEDNTAETFNKENGPYVEEGYMTTSWVDENLIKILKMYNSIDTMFSDFPGDGTAANSTYAKLSYLKDRQANYIDSETYYGTPSNTEVNYSLPNPTLGNRIMIKLTIGRPSADDSITPIVTDLTWKYILQKPREDVSATKNFTFTVLAEDNLEDFTGDYKRDSKQEPVKRQSLLDDLWNASAQKSILNFIGADNVSEIGLKVYSLDVDAKTYITIDRTNYTIYYNKVSDLNVFTGNANIGGGSNEYNYKGKTLAEVVSDLNALWSTDLVFELHRDQIDTRSANDLEPRMDMIVSSDTEENTYLMVGSDVHAVIMGTNTPSQSKLTIDGRGSDRLQVALREAL